MWYLAAPGQTVFPTSLASPSPYGQINLACRTSWRLIEPVATSVRTPDWSTIDDCYNAVHGITGAKWSLSVKIGADAPLWLYSASTPITCPASPVSSPTAEGTPGNGNLIAFPFIWATANMGDEYPDGSTQCVPIPWASNYLSQLNIFIGAVASHVAGYANPSLLDHVVVTGVNTQTAENIQPHCDTTGCGYSSSGGSVTDLDNWATIVGTGCTPSPGMCSQYYSKLGPAYDTIVGDWATAFSSPTFPSNLPVAAMFSDGPVFPFDTNNATGLELLNQLVADEGSRDRHE